MLSVTVPSGLVTLTVILSLASHSRNDANKVSGVSVLGTTVLDPLKIRQLFEFVGVLSPAVTTMFVPVGMLFPLTSATVKVSESLVMAAALEITALLLA